MRRLTLAAALSVLTLLTGCATSQKVTLGQMTGIKQMNSMALIPSAENSADMDNAIKDAFHAKGITPKPALPADTRLSNAVDVIVEYSDQWRWDLVMYLKWVTINMYDARTGNLLVLGRWDNSSLHGFQNYKEVVKDLVNEMLDKERSVSK